MSAGTVYSDATQCRDCNRCVLACPVNAIEMRNRVARVVDDACVGCGECVRICPSSYMRVRYARDEVRTLLRSGRRVVLAISPAWVAEFPDASWGSLVQTLQKLGFREVRDMAEGADHFFRAIADESVAVKGLSFLPTCPAVVRMLQYYYPHYASRILPVASPLAIHIRQLRAELGYEAAIVVLVPCAAEFAEAMELEDVDLAFTFAGLKHWLRDAGEKVANGKPSAHETPATMGGRYVASGELTRLLGGSDRQAFSGLETVKAALTDLEGWEGNLQLELLACKGGCINSPLTRHHSSLAIRHAKVNQRYAGPLSTGGHPVDTKAAYPAGTNLASRFYSQEEIVAQLHSIGRTTASAVKDCGCCGYPSCRQFAIALCAGRAERTMCVPYHHDLAEGKFRVLFNNMPSGVILVDSRMVIIEANWNAARMLGQETLLTFDQQPGLSGLAAEQHIPFHKLFADVLRGGEPLTHRDERVEGHMLRISLFKLADHPVACAIMRDMYASDIRNEEIVKRAEEILQKHLSTVQQIAYLLGENASYTESGLDAIIESFTGEAIWGEGDAR